MFPKTELGSESIREERVKWNQELFPGILRVEAHYCTRMPRSRDVEKGTE